MGNPVHDHVSGVIVSGSLLPGYSHFDAALSYLTQQISGQYSIMLSSLKNVSLQPDY